MKKMLLSSLIAVVVAGYIAIHGDMPDGIRIIGEVGMYYLIWYAAYETMDWAGRCLEEVKKR